MTLQLTLFAIDIMSALYHFVLSLKLVALNLQYFEKGKNMKLFNLLIALLSIFYFQQSFAAGRNEITSDTIQTDSTNDELTEFQSITDELDKLINTQLLPKLELLSAIEINDIYSKCTEASRIDSDSSCLETAMTIGSAKFMGAMGMIRQTTKTFLVSLDYNEFLKSHLKPDFANNPNHIDDVIAGLSTDFTNLSTQNLEHLEDLVKTAHLFKGAIQEIDDNISHVVHGLSLDSGSGKINFELLLDQTKAAKPNDVMLHLGFTDNGGFGITNTSPIAGTTSRISNSPFTTSPSDDLVMNPIKRITNKNTAYAAFKDGSDKAYMKVSDVTEAIVTELTSKLDTQLTHLSKGAPQLADLVKKFVVDTLNGGYALRSSNLIGRSGIFITLQNLDETYAKAHEELEAAWKNFSRELATDVSTSTPDHISEQAEILAQSKRNYQRTLDNYRSTCQELSGEYKKSLQILQEFSSPHYNGNKNLITAELEGLTKQQKNQLSDDPWFSVEQTKNNQNTATTTPAKPITIKQNTTSGPVEIIYTGPQNKVSTNFDKAVRSQSYARAGLAVIAIGATGYVVWDQYLKEKDLTIEDIQRWGINIWNSITQIMPDINIQIDYESFIEPGINYVEEIVPVQDGVQYLNENRKSLWEKAKGFFNK